MSALRHSFLVAAIITAGCQAASTDLPNTTKPQSLADTPAAPTPPPAAPAAQTPPAAPAPAASPVGSSLPGGPIASRPLRDLAPVLASKISSPRQVLDDGPFTGERPSVRAKERHSFEVTGKDCMTCHGTGGPAPHFAFGGTIALGKQWTFGTPTWPTGNVSANSYGSYDTSGSYDVDSGYSTFGGVFGGIDPGSYGTGGYGYDDGSGSNLCALSILLGGGGNYVTGDDDDDGYVTGGNLGGLGSCNTARKGWPSDRTSPSTNTGVRIVGADGYVFDTVTDDDGNFWFKSPADVAVPAFTGIRYGTFTVTGDTNGIACGSCHESGKPDSPGRLWTWDGPTPR